MTVIHVHCVQRVLEGLKASESAPVLHTIDLHNIRSNPVMAVILEFWRLNLFGMQTGGIITCQRETLQPTIQYFTSLNLSVFNTLHISNPKSPINIQGESPLTISDQSWQEKYKQSDQSWQEKYKQSFYIGRLKERAYP